MSVLKANTFVVIPKTISAPYFDNNIMIRYGVPGDGTCFYYSLCAILNTESYLHQSLENQIKIGRSFRCNLSKDLTWEEWLAFLHEKQIEAPKIRDLEDLKDKLCKHRVWADEPIIRFIMYKFHINLIFVDKSLNQLYCGVDEPQSHVTAVIYWVNNSHFEPLGRLNALDLNNDKVGIQFQFYYDKDQDFIQHLMTKYNFQCNI
jgi:hypothetical protein